MISGTSADGIDAVLLEVSEDGRSPAVHRLASLHRAFDPQFRDRIRAAAEDRSTTSDLCRLRSDLADAFADPIPDLLTAAGTERSEVSALGCHGQTVWHIPPTDEALGTSLQLLDAPRLAARTGIPVVSDFRGADLAAGGEGAPLVAWSDPILFRSPDRTRGILNLGGMANVTRVPAEGADDAPVAFDLGPANALLDAAVVQATGGARAWDEEGTWARQGTVDPVLLDRLSSDPWFDRAPPRSTGKERFGAALVRTLAEDRELHPGDRAGWADLLRTLTELSARTVAAGIGRWVPELDELLVAGGGIRNDLLMERIGVLLAPLPVRPLRSGDGAAGVGPDERESAAFALLAWAHLTGRTGNVPAATGATGPRVLGSWTPAPGRASAEDPRETPGGAP